MVVTQPSHSHYFGPERRCTSDHRRSTARPHIACSPAAACTGFQSANEFSSSWPC